MPELIEALTLLVQGLILTAANYLLVLYLTDTTVKGPLDIFERIRYLAGIRETAIYSIDASEEEYYYEVGDRFWAKVLDCHRCSSPYTAFLIIALSWLVGFVTPAWTVIILWLAVTATTILIFELIEN